MLFFNFYCRHETENVLSLHLLSWSLWMLILSNIETKQMLHIDETCATCSNLKHLKSLFSRDLPTFQILCNMCQTNIITLCGLIL